MLFNPYSKINIIQNKDDWVLSWENNYLIKSLRELNYNVTLNKKINYFHKQRLLEALLKPHN